MFCKNNMCRNFNDNVPMLEVARNNATVEMPFSVLGDRHGMWEALFLRNWGFTVNGRVGLVKAIAAYRVFPRAELEIEGQPCTPFAPLPVAPSTECGRCACCCKSRRRLPSSCRRTSGR